MACANVAAADSYEDAVSASEPGDPALAVRLSCDPRHRMFDLSDKKILVLSIGLRPRLSYNPAQTSNEQI